MTNVILALPALCYYGSTARHENECARRLCLQACQATIRKPSDVTQDDAMMKQMPSIKSITAESMVQEIILQYPQTIAMFNRHRLACPGCYISPYHTVADSAREYAIPIEPLLADLNGALSSDSV
jgi:hybrid cluster-associated redox disulfide protein